MAKDDFGLIIGVGIILFLLLYVPQDAATLWTDNCENISGWNPTSSRFDGWLTYNGGNIEAYTGDARAGAACIKISVGYRTVAIRLKETNIDIPLDAEDHYRYVVSGWVKLKTVKGNVELAAYDVNYQKLAGFSVDYSTVVPPFKTGGQLYDSWHLLEMVVTPQKTEYYIDAKLYSSDVVVRPNANIKYFALILSNPGSGDPTAITLFDELYLSTTPKESLFSMIIRIINSWGWGLN